MTDIFNIDPVALPFDWNRYVGDLLFSYYPSTIVYSDLDGDPVIIEWVDEVDGDDLFFIYKTDKSSLEKYIFNQIEHRELIRDCTDNEVFFFKNVISEETVFYKLESLLIDDQYLPQTDVYFDDTLSNDIEKIKTFFGLTDDHSREIRTLSEEHSSDLIEIHLLENQSNVGHGHIDTTALGEILISFETLYKEVARDNYYGINRRTNRTTERNRHIFERAASTEVVANAAASFSVYLKPVQMYLSRNENNIIDSREIFEKIKQIITISSNRNELDEKYRGYSKNVFKQLNNFVNKTLVNKISLDIDYYNQSTRRTYSKRINPVSSRIISRNIIEKVTPQENIIQTVGQFYSINAETNHFSISTLEGKFTGYFDFANFNEDFMRTVNLSQTYNVTIKSIEAVNIGKLRNVAKNTITRAVPVESVSEVEQD